MPLNCKFKSLLLIVYIPYHPIEWVVKPHELTILQPVPTPHHAVAPEGGSAAPSAAAVLGGGVDGQEPGVSCADAGEQQGSLGCIYYTYT